MKRTLFAKSINAWMHLEVILSPSRIYDGTRNGITEIEPVCFASSFIGVYVCTWKKLDFQPTSSLVFNNRNLTNISGLLCNWSKWVFHEFPEEKSRHSFLLNSRVLIWAISTYQIESSVSEIVFLSIFCLAQPLLLQVATGQKPRNKEKTERFCMPSDIFLANPARSWKKLPIRGEYPKFHKLFQLFIYWVLRKETLKHNHQIIPQPVSNFIQVSKTVVVFVLCRFLYLCSFHWFQSSHNSEDVKCKYSAQRHKAHEIRMHVRCTPCISPAPS